MKACDPIYIALILACAAAIVSSPRPGRVENAIVMAESEYVMVVVPP